MVDTNSPYNLVYLRVFEELSDKKRYATWNINEFYVRRGGQGDKNRVNVVVRIDVDSGLHLESELTDVLEEYGIHATHFYLTHPGRYYRIWGSGIPRYVAGKKGQEIGLHSDHYYEELTVGKPSISAIKEDVRRLSKEAGILVKGMAYHGHPGINALGVKNRDIYKSIDPSELGLAYHDGDMGPYADIRARTQWQPKCDIRFSDFSGYPNSYGWSYWPNRPLHILRSMKPGQVLHLTFHTKNAFKYWIRWTDRFGEETPLKETHFIFWKKRIRSGIRFMKEDLIKLLKNALSFLITIFSWFLAMVFGAVCNRWATPDPYRDWNYNNESIWNAGLGYWEERLLKTGVNWINKDVLEIGSGPGHWLAVLSKGGRKVVGVEPSRAMRDWARREFELRNITNVQILEGYAESLPIEKASQDVVLCLGVFQFTEQEKALAEVFRVLRPGGKAFMSTNGFGYYIMRLKMGLGNRDLNRTQQGLIGILNGILRWKDRYLVQGQKPTTVNRFQQIAVKAGLTLREVRLWLDRDVYPLENAGFATNYLFVLEKPFTEEKGEEG